MSNGMCCPNCGNTNLQVVNEVNTSTSGGGYSAGKGCLGYLIFGPLGLLCGACGSKQQTNTTNTTYWVCSKCGHKFKSPQELRKELNSKKGTIPAFIVLGIIMTVLCFFLFFGVVLNEVDATDEMKVFCTIASLMPAVIFFIAAGVTSGSCNRKEGEIYALEQRMKKSSSNNGVSSTSYMNNRTYANRAANSSSGIWRCSKCGRVNQNYVGTCGCGEIKPGANASSSVVHNSIKINDNEWQCSKCGRINQNYVGTCGCGEIKPGLKVTENTKKEEEKPQCAPVSSEVANEKSTGDEFRFCQNCGAKQTLENKFCCKCGTKLNERDL